MRVNKPKGVLKSTPETFVVREIVHKGQNVRHVVPISRRSEVRGKNHWGAPVTLFQLTKRGWAHDNALVTVARHLNVEVGAISSHGMKDRYAITSQHIGIAGEFAPRFDHPDIWLRQIGEAHTPLWRGGNIGNYFEILVLSSAGEIDHSLMKEVPNLFGVQRVGSKGECEVGRMLLEGKFFEAAKRITALKSPTLHAYRQAVAETGDWKKAWLHHSMRSKFVFLTQMWQSLLWNRLVEDCLNCMLPDRLPMWSPVYSELYESIWCPQQLNEDALARLRVFDRATTVTLGNFACERADGGWRFCFDLPSGAYATTALSRVFDLSEPPRR